MAQVADNQLPDRELDGARAAMWDMITGYRLSQIARVAAALSLAEHCAAGPVTAEQIAHLESADPAGTARLLRACAAVGLLTCSDDLYFSATSLLKTLHTDTPGSLRGFALSLPARGHWLPWGQLLEAVRTGKHQAPAALGSELFDYYATASEEADAFTAGLNGMTSVAGAEAARVIDTSSTQLAVDVGGASGYLMHDLMQANPRLRGIVFDLPHVTPDAAAAAARLGLSDRLEAVAGDFFKSVPENGDLYLLRYVLHDWDDDSCVRILANCRKAMRPGGRVLVLEMILGTIGGEPVVVPSQDLNMMAVLGGRERAVNQFDKVFAAAGLRRTAVTSTESPMSVIEAIAA